MANASEIGGGQLQKGESIIYLPTCVRCDEIKLCRCDPGTASTSDCGRTCQQAQAVRGARDSLTPTERSGEPIRTVLQQLGSSPDIHWPIDRFASEATGAEFYRKRDAWIAKLLKVHEQQNSQLSEALVNRDQRFVQNRSAGRKTSVFIREVLHPHHHPPRTR